MSYSKMVVIPQEEYLQLSSANSVQEFQSEQQPITTQLKELTRKDNEIEKIKDPYRRMQLQAENIEERRLVRDKLRRFITLSTPRQFRLRAERLFDFIDPYIKFNERGEILDDASGDVIRNSHIDDLLQYAVRDVRRKLGAPEGWKYFRDVLSTHNVPHNIIGNPTVSELIKSPPREIVKPDNIVIKREPEDSLASKTKSIRIKKPEKKYSKY